MSPIQNNNIHISPQGIRYWHDANLRFTAYVKIVHPGELNIAIRGSSRDGSSTIQISLLHQSREIIIDDPEIGDYAAGTWQIQNPGYIAIEISGIRKQSQFFAELESLILSGSSATDDILFVRNNEDGGFYYGLRGPSVHISPIVSAEINIEWFYNELTIERGNDINGSYFMAAGFSQGYMGIQRLRNNEKWILFSLWSEAQTDNPTEVPDHQKIRLIAKDERTIEGEFGNEGTGGKSYMHYDWQPNTTYRFLVKATPTDDNCTVFSGYFYCPITAEWLLIASFSRPNLTTYLTGLYSFNENFYPEYGAVERSASFTNPWVRDVNGAWTEIEQVRVTADATARNNFRSDFLVTPIASGFKLSHCGFFDETIQMDITLDKPNRTNPPNIELPH